MNHPKLENLLNLALDSTESEREKSLNLNVGYDGEEKTWELIVKGSGDLKAIATKELEVVELLNGYAILTVKESLISYLTELPQIEYIEKPKRLFFAVDSAKRASGITPVQREPLNLTGKGVLLAVLDSGVDYAHPEFRKADGNSRILNLWDQTIDGNLPKGYKRGSEYTKEDIDQALAQPTKREQLEIVPSVDISGHGTKVLGIAANIASESDLLVVKLGTPKANSFPKTTELMLGINYCMEKALEYGKPVAINLSFGNTYGSHNGTSLLETYLVEMSNIWKNVICVGTGNEGYSEGHTHGTFNIEETIRIELAVSLFQTTLNIQLWKQYVDTVEIFMRHPNGREIGPLLENTSAQRYVIEGTEILVYYGEPRPYSVDQEIYFELLPLENYIDTGLWDIVVIPKKIKEGNYDLWLPSSGVLNKGTRFLLPTESGTLTIPSTASKVISVGAYNHRTQTYADFSGRGKREEITGSLGIKPDLVAPGVEIQTATVGGGYGFATGTSFATPFVTGAATLLMEWGIVQKNDPFLYGEKVKAYLTKGAKEVLGYEVYPNNQVGACVILVLG